MGEAPEWSDRLFRVLLLLYPPAIRRTYGAEMAEVFHRSAVEAARRGRWALCRLWLRTLRDTAVSAPAFWIRGIRRGPGGSALARRTTKTRAGRWEVGMTALWQDVRVAVRGFGRRPGFTAVVLLTLVLAIGGTTAIFSLVNATLLAPLPYPAEERLVMLYNSPEAGAAFVGFSEPFYLALASEPGVFSALAALAPGRANVGGEDHPERVAILRASAEFFDVAGIPPALGRAYGLEEDRPGADGVVVISHGLRERRFGGDLDVLGRTLVVDGRAREIVGVMSPGFGLFQNDVELWVPLAVDRPSLAETDAVNNNRVLVGRLADGVDARSAEIALTRALARVRARFPDAVTGDHGVRLSSYREWLVGDVRRELLLLLAAVSAVLLIACANLANLFLARAETRRREIAVRTALGARAGWLVRHLLSESVVLGLVGAALGLGLGMLLLELVRPLVPPAVPLPEEGVLDGTVLAFTAGVGIATGVLFGLPPVLGSRRPRIREVLDKGGRGEVGEAGGLARRMLVLVEMSLATVLLVAAGLLASSLWRLQSVDPGFALEDRAAVELSLPAAGYPTAEPVEGFYRPLVERVERLPGVAGASVGQWIPLEGAVNWGYEVEGSTEGVRFADYNLVGPSYFEVLEIPVVRGRSFEWRDMAEDRPVVIVTEALARVLWPGEEAIGRRINVNIDRRIWREVVGVVGEVRNRNLGSDPTGMLYFPPVDLPFSGPRQMHLVVRERGEGDVRVADLRRIVAALDPTVPVGSVRPLEAVVAASEAQRRFLMTLLTGFGALALGLAGVGLYGVLSYTLSLRTREIGVRIALGADRASVVTMALREAGLLAGVGLLLGLGGAVVVSRLLTSFLYGVTPVDPWTYGGAVAFLVVVAGAATWIPARRAAGLDPTEALRKE